jgi:thermitase
MEELRFSFIFYLLLLGIISAQSILLTWDDNSEDEQGFFIERTVSDECRDDWEVIAYTGVNQNFLMDIHVPGACYRVAAYNESGSSTYSNTAQVPLEPASLR